MLKEQAKLFTRLNVLVDVLVVSTALVLAYFVRSQVTDRLFPLQKYIWILIVVIPTWHFLLQKNALYSSIRRLSFADIFFRLLKVHFFGGFIVAAFIYFFDRLQYSRSLYVLFIGFSFLLMLIEKVVLRSGLGYVRRRGYNIRNLLIVGTCEKAQNFHRLVDEHADWGLRLLGFIKVAECPPGDQVAGHKVLGHVKDLVEICKSRPVDEVVFCLSKSFLIDAEEALHDLEELGITVRMVLDFYDVPKCRKELSFFHGELPILTFHTKAFDAQQLFLKRLLDLFGSVFGLGMLLLVFPFIALAIKLESPGPIFFSQERVGEGGRVFRCWKFRSMYIDAESRKAELLAFNEMNGAIFKIKNDPRVTRVGRFLRRTSLDEFPQFWNVLKGEMSLVGTRPPTPDEVAQYENWHRRRISIKPGITGNWQVSGRNVIDDFDQIVKLDLQYIDTWSLWLDLKLLARTFWVVLAGRGSC